MNISFKTTSFHLDQELSYKSRYILNITYSLNRYLPSTYYVPGMVPGARDIAVSKQVKILDQGASLVAQWLGIHLPMQGTRVRALVQEDPTCRGATKPVRHNYWACALEPVSHNYWVRVLQLLKPACLELVLRNKRSHRDEKPAHRNKE